MLERVKVFLIGGAIAAVLATIGIAYVQGRADGVKITEAQAGKRALERIGQLEKSNANFNRLDDRGRCLVFMRDSGLPDSACD